MRLRKKHWAIPEMKENKYVFFNPIENKSLWKNIFCNDNPIHLEIGSGKGKFIVESVKKNPDINYIAMEKDGNAFAYAARKFLKEELNNIRGICNAAENLSYYFSKDELDKIYINFCNPWPKKSHHKRRLSHPRLLNIYKTILKDKGEIELKTDSISFFEDSIGYFMNENFEIVKKISNLSVIESDIISEYESKWRKAGIDICYTKVRLNKN